MFKLSARFPVPYPQSKSVFSVVRLGPDDRPMNRHGTGPSRRPVLLESSRGGAAYPGRAPDGQCAQAVRPGCGPVCVGVGVVSFKFVVASRSESLRSHLTVFGPLALRRIGSCRRGLPGRERDGLAWSARRAPLLSSGLEYVIRASRQYP